MSTTPTLLNLIDAYAEARHTYGDSTYNATTKAARDAVVAALTQGAGEAVEPVAWQYRNAVGPTFWQECGAEMAEMRAQRPEKWEVRPLYSAPPTQLLQQAVDRALEPIQQAIRDYHHALDTHHHGGVAKRFAFEAICDHLGMHWQQGKEAEARAKGTHD